MAAKLLTDRAVQNAKPKSRPYRLADGDSLYLLVSPTGSKSWQLRYRHNGVPQTASLGKLELVGLAEARKKALAARRSAAEGEHLTREKRVAKARKAAAASNRFDSLARAWLKREAKRKGWTPDYVIEATGSVERHLQKLNGLPVEQITAAITSPVLRKIEAKAPAMEEKVHRRLYAIMDYAVEVGALRQNPLPRRRARKSSTKHFPAVVDLPGIGAILRKSAASDPCRGIQRAHVLLAFTAQRVSEVVGARWGEFDLTAQTWAIPRVRMKKKDAERGPHLVPLPANLAAQLHQWQVDDNSKGEFVCPAPRDPAKSVTPEACEKHYRDALGLGGKHSPHSWRSAFKTVCSEAGKEKDVVESQLDHQAGTKVESAYDRAKRLDLRRELMTWYEATLIAARDGARVVPLQGHAKKHR